VGYRGTAYAGWEAQDPARTRGRPTLQGALETALGAALGHPVRVSAAGRTDAGVHADAQVVACDTTSSLPIAGLRETLPRWLPPDLWLVDAEDAPRTFDPRGQARRRWYRYVLWCGPAGAIPTGWRGRIVVAPPTLDLAAMRTAAWALVGRRDFAAVTARPLRSATTVRTVFAADWLWLGPSLLALDICADAFLTHMVRILVGSLLWVGTARWAPADFADALLTGDRQATGPTAPAAGLTLIRIEY
jgi:tRNA pseudouridine38-40 synthase